DPKNKSNFLFLAVHWAQMLLFETWTNHPNAAAVTNQKFLHLARSDKKKAIIFVVNGPDRFEPNELTYLGFNNDASEIPMFEADTINFSYNYGTSPIKSTKGALVYTGAGTYNTTQGSYVVTSGTGKLTFPEKGILKIVVTATQSPSSCSFTNINNVNRRIEFDRANVASSLTQNTTYSIAGTKTFYLTPDQISDTTDSDGNYYINFSLVNVRLVSAEITNRPIETITPTCSVTGTTNALEKNGQTAGVIVNVKAPLKIKVKTKNLAKVTFYNDNQVSDCKIGSTAVTLGSEYAPASATTFTFSGPTKEMWNWEHNTVAISGTTGGVNFGHNLSLYKVKYRISGATISSATLSNQILRCYAHYGYGSSGVKAIILNDGHAGALIDSPEKYLDPCISTNASNSSTGWIWGGTGSVQLALIKAYDFYPTCYGLTKNAKFLMAGAGDVSCYSSADPVNPYISMEPSSGTWPQIKLIIANNHYNVADLKDHTPKNTDRITIFTGRFEVEDAYWSEEADADSVDFGYCAGTHNASGGCKNCKAGCNSGYSIVSTSCDWLNWLNTDCGCKVRCKKLPNLVTRYDLNSFFFVNMETKSYSTSTDKNDVIKNKHIATLQKDNFNWICFCGDGKLDVTVTPTPGTIGYKNASNADQSSSVASFTDVDYDISPETHLYVLQSDGTYKIALTLTNVQISNARMNNTSSVTRYAHPNLTADGIKNVRIVDFGYSDSSKPRKYGNVVFGSDVNGNLGGKAYENLEHLKYWTTSGNNNHLYRTDEIAGDYFVQLLDFNGNIPAVQWFFSENGAYGPYTNNYSFSGLHRVFFPQGEQEYHATYGARVNLISTGVDQKMAFVFGGFTCPINNVLMLNGYQTGAGTGQIAPPTTTNSPDAAVAIVTADACTKLAAAVGSNTMVYVIKYKTTDTSLNSCVATGKIKTYSVSSETDLNETLHEIAADIKSFAGYSAPQTEEIDP
ncbi:MAG: hypothetical protein LBJ96_02515, partial [Holosporaceae bacterium]|nr:hypothetical protein [Holosporaceae bacterium]